jgi:hypothetical protein
MYFFSNHDLVRNNLHLKPKCTNRANEQVKRNCIQIKDYKVLLKALENVEIVQIQSHYYCTILYIVVFAQKKILPEIFFSIG